MYGPDETSSSPQEILCRTEAGLEMRRIVRWMISEPGSPWCAAQLAVVELRNGEQIGWDAMGQPIARRTKVRWQRTTRGGRVVLADLACAVLEELALDMGIKRCDELVGGVDHWARQTGRPPVRTEEIYNAIRFLRKRGYVEREPRAGSPAAYRLTPCGYAVTVLHRRACREENPVFDLPTPEQVGGSFEDLPVHFLDLPPRTLESLEGAGIQTVRELARRTRDDQLRLADLGGEAVAQIMSALDLPGLQDLRAGT